VLVVVGAVVTAGYLWSRRPTAPSTPLDPKTVAVAIFENRTGDRSLESLGKSLAQSVADGLAPVEAVKVVPSATVFQMAASAETSGGMAALVRRLAELIGVARGNSDPVRRLANATGAGLIVSGSFDVQGQALWVRTSLTDATANKPCYTVSPIEVPREKATEAVKLVQQQVLDTVAARYFNPWQNLLLEETRPPRFDAKREYLAGFELVPVKPDTAARHLDNALKLDADFVGPHFGLKGVANSQGRWDEQAARAASLEQMVGRMTPLAKRRLAFAKASITDPSQMEEALTASRDIVRLSPDSVNDAWLLGVNALTCNYPAEAVDALTKKGLRWDLIVSSSSPNGPQHFRNLTAALHLLGRHREELEAAQQGGRIYAGSLNLRAYEARALAALGRLDEVDRLVREVLTMSRQTYGHYFLPRGTPGYVMRAAAEDLRRHGHRDASLATAGRAVDWFKSRVGDEEKLEDTRSGLGDALYQAERWQESKAVFAELAKHPENYDQDINYQGRLGTLAARLGNAPGARRIAETLRRRVHRWQDGKHTFRAARILALLGDKDGAVRLLTEAIAQGAGISEIPDAYGYGFIFTHCMDLESLRGYAPSEALIKPKG
jgi:tetratricopeptide (TPR) repeat protein